MVFDWGLVLDNLIKIGIGLGIFTFMWFSNFAFSIWYNIGQLKQKFEWKRLLLGLGKLVAVLIGTASLAVGVTLIIPYLQYVGLEITDAWINNITIITIVTVIVTACATYGKEAIATLADIFSKK